MRAVSVQDTLVYVMVSISASDSQMGETELKRIGNVVKMLPVFDKFSGDQLVNASKACADILQDDEGLETVLELAASLPRHLHETAYALAAEIAASDRKVAAEEIRLLQMLRNKLSVDKLTCAALERGAQARHQTE